MSVPQEGKAAMAVQITWQSSPTGPFELWLVEGGQPSRRLFAVAPDRMGMARPPVQRRAEQADSVPEFLEMMHLEDLIDLYVLRHLLAEQMPLYRIWAKLRQFCREAGDIGEFPAQWIALGTTDGAPPEAVVHLPEAQVNEALTAWRHFEEGDHQAL